MRLDMRFVFICKKVGLFYINRTCKHENSDVSPLQTSFFPPILILPFTLTILFHWMNWQNVFFQNKLDFLKLFGYEINWSDIQVIMFGNKCACCSKPAAVWICENTARCCFWSISFLKLLLCLLKRGPNSKRRWQNASGTPQFLLQVTRCNL